MAKPSLSELATVHHQRLFALLRRHAYEKRDVVLASGRRSDFYIDCRNVVLTAEGHFLVGWLLHYLIRQVCPTARGVGGMSMGADPLVSATSLLSYLGSAEPLCGFYVRKEPKGHGTGRQLEGQRRLPEGAEVAIVEDVVTSGGSALRAVEAAREAGLRPLHVLALVDRQEGGTEAITAELPLSTLFAAEDFK